MRILLDVDEVLADWVGGACRKWAVDPLRVLAHWTPGEWGVVPPLSAAMGLKASMTEEDFWRPLDNDADFWADLQMLPWAEELLRVVKDLTDDWFLVSSPSWCDSSYTGKIRWAKRHFGRSFNRLIVTPHKYALAMPGVVLVDDHEQNLDRFSYGPKHPTVTVATGGCGILFPRHHNRLHTTRERPVDLVAKALERFRKECEQCT